MAAPLNNVAVIEDLDDGGVVQSSSNKSSSASGKNTVTAFRGVWQAKVGPMHHSQQQQSPEVLKEKTLKEAHCTSEKKTKKGGSSFIEHSIDTDLIPSVYQIDLSSEEVSDRKSATSQVKVTAGTLWQTLSPWKRHNKVAPSPQNTSKIVKKTRCKSKLDSSSLFVEDNKENTLPSSSVEKESDMNESYYMTPVKSVDHRSSSVKRKESSKRPSPEYSKITKPSQSPPPPLPPPPLSPLPPPPPPLSPLPPPPSLSPPPPKLQDGRTRYIETHPSPIKSSFANHDTVDIIRVLSQSPLSADQDSLYESLHEDENEYSEIINDIHSQEGGVKLLSIKGQISAENSNSFGVIDSPEEGLLLRDSNVGMLPIHYAAAKGNKKELRGVLSQLPIIQDPVERVLGSDKFCTREGVDVRDGEGRTALMHAVHHEHFNCVKLLSKSGANINIQTLDGSTCLHEAAHSGSIEMIALLLSLGANGMQKDNEGRLPLHWCMNNHNSDCAKLLLDKVLELTPNVYDGSHMTPLMWAGYYGRSENVELLKQKRGDTTLADCEGMRAIHWSTKSHDLKTLKVLLTTDSASYEDHKGRTVIHYAAKEGFAKAVSIIKGTSPLCINDQDHNGRTSLHWAAACEKPDVIRALLSTGADPNIKDAHGYTALDYAVQKHLPYCSLLLAQGEQEAAATMIEHQ